MRISDWSSDVCSSDLMGDREGLAGAGDAEQDLVEFVGADSPDQFLDRLRLVAGRRELRNHLEGDAGVLAGDVGLEVGCDGAEQWGRASALCCLGAHGGNIGRTGRWWKGPDGFGQYRPEGQ